MGMTVSPQALLIGPERLRAIDAHGIDVEALSIGYSEIFHRWVMQSSVGLMGRGGACVPTLRLARLHLRVRRTTHGRW